MAKQPQGTDLVYSGHAGVYRQHYADGTWAWWIRARVRGQGERARTLPATLTPGEAVDARERLVQELAGVAPAHRRRTTVRGYSQQWLRERSGTLKPSTRDRYVAGLADHILPELGHLPLDEVNRAAVQSWCHRVSRKQRPDGERYAHGTVLGWWALLRGMLRDAAADADLPDPTRRVRPPSTGITGRRTGHSLSASELAGFLDFVRRRKPDWYPEVLVLAYTGMPPGELYELRWSDIDWERGVVTVSRAVWRGEVGGTKTGKTREMVVPRLLVDVLREHQAEQGTIGHTLIFPAGHGGHRLTQTLRTTCVRLSRRLGCPQVTPYVLRYTFRTLVRSAGIPEELVSGIQGHSLEVGRSYFRGHLDAKRGAVEALRELLEVEG